MTTTYQLHNGLIEEVVDGAASGKFIEGPVFIAVSPASQATFTQTYSTASATVPADTFAASASKPAATAATNSSPYGYAQAQADAIVTAVRALVDDVAAVAADALATKKALNKVIDVLQSAGFAA